MVDIIECVSCRRSVNVLRFDICRRDVVPGQHGKLRYHALDRPKTRQAKQGQGALQATPGRPIRYLTKINAPNT